MVKQKSKGTRVKRETTRQRPETTSREAKIKMMVGAGLGNAAIWAALEAEFPHIIQDDKHRAAVAGKKIDYDAEERGRVSRALNSTRALAIKDDERVMSIVSAVGGDTAQAKTLDELDMLNRHRFGWGISALDYIYGQTKYVHLSHAPNSKFKKQVTHYKQRDDSGVVQKIEKIRQVWISGDWKAGDPMIPNDGGYVSTRDADGNLLSDLDLKLQIIEHGCPEGFMSIWGGEPGVGKTKLAVAASKSINEVTEEAILYINGEDSEENFRMKVGNDANPDLFRVITANMLPVQAVCDAAYEIKPRLIIIDSVQTLAEWDKGQRGQNGALIILRTLMADVRAGRPHIVLISQLNKANELKGARDLEHLADLVAQVTKVDGRKGVFQFEVPRKNRGGETPRGALFKHTELSVACVSDSSLRSTSLYQLEQPTAPVIENGIVDLPLTSAKQETEGDEAEDAGTDE